MIDQAGTIETSVLARLVLDGNPGIGSRRPALCVRIRSTDNGVLVNTSTTVEAFPRHLSVRCKQIGLFLEITVIVIS